MNGLSEMLKIGLGDRHLTHNILTPSERSSLNLYLCTPERIYYLDFQTVRNRNKTYPSLSLFLCLNCVGDMPRSRRAYCVK